MRASCMSRTSVCPVKVSLRSERIKRDMKENGLVVVMLLFELGDDGKARAGC